MALTKVQIAGFEERLKKMKLDLEGQVKELEEHPPEFGSDEDHLEGEGNEAEAFGSQLAVAGGLRTRLTDVDEALTRIEHGTYGVCEGCKGEIDEKMLSMDPETRLCKECKLAER